MLRSVTVHVGCARFTYVIGVVDHELVLMRVSEEHVSDDMRRVAFDDLIEQIRRVGKRIGAIPSRENMSKEPDTLAGVFCSLQLFDNKFERPADIWIAGIDEVQKVAMVPKVTVEGDHPQTVVVLKAVCAVMQPCLFCVCLVQPAFVQPERCYMVVVPTHLLTERARQRVRRINGLWIGVVIAKNRKDGPREIVYDLVSQGRDSSTILVGAYS